MRILGINGITRLLALAAGGLTLLFFSQGANAQDDKQTDKIPLPNCAICELLDAPRDFLSDNFMNMSDRLDIFFSNNATFEELDKSYPTLRKWRCC